MVLVVKNLPANAGDIRDVGLIPGSGRSPGGRPGNPFQYSWLEWIPWTEEPGGLQSIGLQRLGHDWSNLACTQAALIGYLYILLLGLCFAQGFCSGQIAEKRLPLCVALVIITGRGEKRPWCSAPSVQALLSPNPCSHTLLISTSQERGGALRCPVKGQSWKPQIWGLDPGCGAPGSPRLVTSVQHCILSLWRLGVVLGDGPAPLDSQELFLAAGSWGCVPRHHHC